MTITKPEFRKENEDYIFAWPEYTISVKSMKEDNFGLKANVWVNMTTPPEGARGHVTWGELRLCKQDERARFAKNLGLRVNNVDWQSMMEYAVTISAEEFSKPQALINLAYVAIPESRPYLVPWLLPENQSSLWVADGESGKSLAGMEIAMACHCGLTMANNLKPARKVPVIYVDWETDEVEQARRLDWIARGHGIARPPIYYYHAERSLAADLSTIRGYVRDVKAGLVIIDSLGVATDQQLKDSDAAKEIFRSLRTLGATTLSLHHITKEEAGTTGKAKPFGSVYFRNLARNVWGIRSSDKLDGSKALSFWHDKDNNGRKRKKPLGFRVLFDDENKTIKFTYHDVEGDVELSEHGGPTYMIRVFLKKGAADTKEIAESLCLEQEVVKTALHKMSDAFCIEQGGGRGKPSRWQLKAREETV